MGRCSVTEGTEPPGFSVSPSLVSPLLRELVLIRKGAELGAQTFYGVLFVLKQSRHCPTVRTAPGSGRFTGR